MHLDSPVTTDAEIYCEHAAALIRFATVLVGPNDAADVVSSAVLRSICSPGWSSVENHRSYLHQAVANEVRNLHRAESRRRERETRAASAPVVHPPEVHPEIWAAVDRLSVRQRAAVFLAYWEDMTDDAIAGYLGISAGSVRRHLARARRHLRRVLDE